MTVFRCRPTTAFTIPALSPRRNVIEPFFDDNKILPAEEIKNQSLGENDQE